MNAMIRECPLHYFMPDQSIRPRPSQKKKKKNAVQCLSPPINPNLPLGCAVLLSPEKEAMEMAALPQM